MIDIERVKKFILEKQENELPASLYYHNVGHVLDVYDSVVRHAVVAGLDNEATTLLKTAALFHDSGFIIKAQGHEEVSCVYAREFLPGFGYDETQISQICGMIMATKIPQSPKNTLEEIMADADLDYLGRDDFFEISDTLYEELKKRGEVEDENQWNIIQVKFFEQHQYFTKTARELRQAKKMEHLEIIKSKIQ